MYLMQTLLHEEGRGEIEETHLIMQSALAAASACHETNHLLDQLQGAFECFGESVAACEGADAIHNNNLYTKLAAAQTVLHELGAALAAFSFPDYAKEAHDDNGN